MPALARCCSARSPPRRPTPPLSSSARTWTTFAATGDPGWPAYDPQHRLTQIFDSVTTVAAYPEERSRLLWRDFPFSTLPLVQPAG